MIDREERIRATQEAAREMFKYARQVPPERWEWKPLDQGRSVLDLCREVVMSPVFSTLILEGKPMPSFEASGEAECGPTLATPEECEAATLANLEPFFAAIRAFPEARLSETYVLPFDGGQPITMAENMDYPRWNMTYHQGQIAYIQTLYGDPKVYW